MSDLSRVEQLLRNALGEDIYNVTPQSRVEILLAQLNELIEGMGGGSVSPEGIATAVAAYLDEHLTNPTSPPVDTSLAIAGAAADAKKTGDEIGDLKENLISVATGGPTNVYPTFQLGYLHDLPNYTPANPGHNSANNVVCGTNYISVADAEKLYFDSSNYKLCICYYNENKEYQTYVGFVSTPNPYVLDTDYAYFVPELRKTDLSAFSDDIPEDKLWYSGQVYNADIVRHGEFNNALVSIETEISNIVTKKIIHSDILPVLPYDVYRTLDGYMCDTPITGLDTSDWVTVYVDSVNGLDTNDGTENNPVKTLTRADYLCRVAMNDTNNKKAIMQIADNSVFYIDDIPQSYNARKSYVIRADHRATIFAGKKPAFSASGNHYTSEALIDYNPIGCVDTSTQDDYGLYNPMVAVASENDVDETLNSYYIDAANKVVYVNPSSDINDIVVIFSNKYAMNPATYGFVESSFFMIENITFVGNSTATGRASSTVGETITRTIFVKNCVFQHGFTNNCVSFNDFDYIYIVDCISGYARYDCFNYHFTRKPTPTNALVVEVNNKSKEAGYYNSTSGYSDNLTTCHEGANILRCGCHGYNANGGMCADVNGCYSVCLDCTFVNTAYGDTMGVNRPAFFFEDVSGTRNGKTVLQDCYGYDSRNNKMVSAVDLILNGMNAGGSISATSIKVGKKLI